MKTLIYLPISLFCFLSFQLHGQTFSASIGSTIDLTGAVATCATATTATSPQRVSVVVSGLSNLSSSNALGKIVITLDNSCTGSSANLNLVKIYIKSPTGTCQQVYNGGLSTSATGTHALSFVSGTSCSNIPSTANGSGDPSVSGTAGIYSAYDGSSTVDLTTLFSGQNPNGTWSIYFQESTTSEPCLVNASLVFGNPATSDQTLNGDNCVSAINWNGSPMCASTNTKTASSNLPGWAGPGASTFGTFAGGVTCAWNGSNDNDTWIKFTAQSSTVCINISGLDQNTQSIVVTDPNTDGDNNACTGAGAGQYWSLASCPRNSPAIYGTTAGTDDNQNHCFTAMPGQTYYLVVDGNGGAESPFFVNGVLGTTFVLPINLINFDFSCQNNQLKLNWTTATETNNSHFTILGSSDAIEWLEAGNVVGSGNSLTLINYNYDIPVEFSSLKYFKLAQTDYDGTITYSGVISPDCEKYNQIEFAPNPFDNEIKFNINSDRIVNYEIVTVLGQIVNSGVVSKINHRIELSNLASDIYFLKIDNSKSYKIIKQ
jgi:hypothetical protein